MVTHEAEKIWLSRDASVRTSVRPYVRTETALRVRECMCCLWTELNNALRMSVTKPEAPTLLNAHRR